MARKQDEMAWWERLEANRTKRQQFIDEAKVSGFSQAQAEFLADKYYGDRKD